MPDNAFLRFRAAGYTRLIPITPPGAPVSDRSSLAKRQRDLGKAPGVRGSDGLWRGVDWLKLQPRETDFEAWHDMGAGVGIRTGDGLIAVDIDTLDAALGDICGKAANEVLGASPNRVGRAPKRLKLYRVSEDVPYQRLTFAGGHVEILSEGRQFVASGTHPATGKPYEWPSGVPQRDTLPLVTPATLAAFFDRLRAALPAAKHETATLAADHVADATQLVGRHDDVVRAIRALPNTTELFPTYQSYVTVAQALKGALPDDDALALELFQEWAAKWPEGNDPDRVAADFQRCQPSRSLGAQYLFHLAERHGGGSFSAADAWFAAPSGPPVDLNPFAAQTSDADAVPAVEPITWRDPADWQDVTPPTREWEVKDWIPRYEVTLLYGEGGIGKTLLAQMYATAAAAGKPWLAQETRPAKVMCFFCEDSDDELHRRQIDICRSLGVRPADLRGRLRIASRRYMDNLLAVFSRSTAEMRRTAVFDRLAADAVEWGADVVIVDTVADTYGGSEIDRAQVNAFVKSCLGQLAKVIGGSVIALAHPSVGGRSEGRSGSTAWANAARSRLYLQYLKGQENSAHRELVSTKTNYSAKGAQIRLKWEAGAFVVPGQAPAGIDLNALKTNGTAPQDIAAMAEAAVLAVLTDAEAAEMPLNLSPRSSAYAPKVLMATYRQPLAMFKAAEIHAAIVALQARSAIRATEFRTSQRNLRPGFAVLQAPAPRAQTTTAADTAAAAWFSGADVFS